MNIEKEQTTLWVYNRGFWFFVYLSQWNPNINFEVFIHKVDGDFYKVDEGYDSV